MYLAAGTPGYSLTNVLPANVWLRLPLMFGILCVLWALVSLPQIIKEIKQKKRAAAEKAENQATKKLSGPEAFGFVDCIALVMIACVDAFHKNQSVVDLFRERIFTLLFPSSYLLLTSYNNVIVP